MQVEIALLVLHKMACFVLYNGLMLVTIGVCRVPRLIMTLVILIFLNRIETESKKKWYKYENVLRLVTCCMMPFFSIGIQTDAMLNKFCSLHPSPLNQEKCHLNYGVTLGVLILVNIAIDVYLQCMHKKWCEFFEKTGGIKQETQPEQPLEMS